MDIKLRPILTGILSLLPGLFDWWDKRRPMGNTASSKYCRGIWRMHLDRYREATGLDVPQSVGELGPGASLGTCIAALLDGVNHAIAMDSGYYADMQSNLRIFHDLIEEPTDIINDDSFKSQIKEACEGGNSNILKYVAPWADKSIYKPSSLELIFSHSVMEHVTDPVKVYESCHYWLKPGGIMSHRIDHSSHGITHSWNGHYKISNILWNIIVGKRPYLLNRKTPDEHISAIKAAGFEILPQTYFLYDTGIGFSEINELPDNPFSIKTSTILARKI